MKSLLFVDDDPNLLRGLKRGLHSLRSEWNISTADTGKEALELMLTSPTDVIISDYRMPGMNGYELLSQTQKRHPETIRIMLTGQPDRETYADLISLCHYFLWKPLDIIAFTQLLNRLKQLDSILSDQKLQRILHGLSSLPTLPETYRQLTALLDDPDSDLKSIVDLVKDDAALTLQILKLVNSSAIGLVRQIKSLEEAVQYLSLNTLRSLVLGHHIFCCFSQQSICEFNLEDLWLHSFTTAQIAEALVQRHKDCYLSAHASFAGLLHDVGKLVLSYCVPDTSRDIYRLQRTKKISNLEAEIQIINSSHAAVGAYLANLWGLPHPVVEAIFLHHVEDISDFYGQSEITKAVWHANRIARGQLEGSMEEVKILRRMPLLSSLPQLKIRSEKDE